MKFFKLLFGLAFIGMIGGFVWLAVTDVPIEKTTIKKTINNERFFVSGS